MYSHKRSNSIDDLMEDWINSPPYSYSSTSDEEDKQLQIRKKSKIESRKGEVKEEEELKKKWVEFPSDVVSLIFKNLGVIDLLYSAQSVCSIWRNVSKQSCFWRSINIRRRSDLCVRYDYLQNMIREAVDRSSGELDELILEGLGTDQLLLYVAERCNTLRCLRLISCNGVSGVGLTKIAKKNPLLEKLELCDGNFRSKEIENVGNLLNQMKSFRLNDRGYQNKRLWGDDHALVIANSMPQLLHLHLFGCSISDYGLSIILDGCPHLESLDLRRCFRLRLQGDLLDRIADAGITSLKLPWDSTDDYEYDFYD